MKHTILGAGGSVGNALAYELLKNKQSVRLVSRSKYLINGAEAFQADISKLDETLESVKKSDVVYICAGLKYDYKVWAALWPKIIENSIEACKRTNAKLIFFDNVYMYGKVDGPMTETTPFNPCSKKGELRAKLASRLEEEMARNDIDVMIARAADLYGPYATNSSIPYILVIDKLMHRKKAAWMLNATLPHSFTYTLDCGKALYMLSNKNDAYNQVWHMPTFNPAIDGKTFIELVANELSVGPKYSIFSKFILKLAGLFDKTIAEMQEMLYQNEFPYHFDSTKFNNSFGYNPKPYKEGIAETIQFVKSNLSSK